MRLPLAAWFFIWIVGGALAIGLFVILFSQTICSAAPDPRQANQDAYQSADWTNSLLYLFDEPRWFSLAHDNEQTPGNRDGAAKEPKSQTRYPLICDVRVRIWALFISPTA
jgi:hypothetical protein